MRIRRPQPPHSPDAYGALDVDHLAAHWEELLRLTTSFRVGMVTASTLLRRLAAYLRQNGLALALRELGRIEHTMFTLDWRRDPALRRRANAGLNKGEMRDRNFESQAYRASGLNLLVSAIILWNTRYLRPPWMTAHFTRCRVKWATKNKQVVSDLPHTATICDAQSKYC